MLLGKFTKLGFIHPKKITFAHPLDRESGLEESVTMVVLRIISEASEFSSNPPIFWVSARE